MFKGAITSPAIYDPRVASIAEVAAFIEGIYASVGFAPFDSDEPAVKRIRTDRDAQAPFQ